MTKSLRNIKMSTIVLALLLTMMSQKGEALSGFNCEAPRHIEVYSAKSVEPCRNHELTITHEKVPGQVIQKLLGKQVWVTQCKAMFDVSLANCGAYGHLEGIYPDFPPANELISPEECSKLLLTKTYNFKGIKNIEVHPNSTVEETFYWKGSVSSDGDHCESGGKFEYGGYAVYDAVVPVVVSLTVRSLPSVVDLANDQVVIGDLVRCPYSQASCFDDALGTLVWTIDPTPCKSSQFVVLYTGLLTWFNSTDARGVVLEDKTKVAVVRPTKKVNQCGMALMATTLEDIFLSDVMYELPVSKGSADIFTYFETRLEYIYYKSMASDAVNLQWVSEALCRIEKETTRNKIDIVARTSPGKLISFEEEGIAYVVNGETIYRLECEEIHGIIVRDTKTCYEDLPVSVPRASLRNFTSTRDMDFVIRQPPEPSTASSFTNMFLSPRSRILTSVSAEAVCSRVTPFSFEVNGHWFVVHPERALISTPHPFPRKELPRKPNGTQPFLPYDSIFSAKDVEDLSHSMRIPKVREAVMTNIVRKMSGLSTEQHYDITSSITAESLETAVKNTFTRIWNVFTLFGTTMSGIIGVWLIFKFISSIATTMFNCAAIYRTTGISFKLLGAIFTSLTSYFVATSSRTNHHPKPDTEMEMVRDTARVAAIEGNRDARNTEASIDKSVPGGNPSSLQGNQDGPFATIEASSMYHDAPAASCPIASSSVCNRELYPNLNNAVEPPNDPEVTFRRYVP